VHPHDALSGPHSHFVITVARVPDYELVKELNEVIDETFNTAEDADLSAKAKDIVSRSVQAFGVASLVSLLQETDELNVAGLERLGGTKFATFTRSPGASAAATPGANSPGAKVPLNLAAVSELLVTGTTSTPAATSSYFTFSVLDKPERLVVNWSTKFDSDFLKACTQIAKALREEKRDPSFIEFVVSVS
jgi:hypothetical protein